MALVLADRVQEYSTTSGTGTLTLSGAVAGFQTFATAIGNGNTCYYTITSDANQWEVGIGTVGTDTLARTTLISSSTGSLVSFTGTLVVFVTYPANKAVVQNAAGVVTGYPITVKDDVFTLQDNLDPTKQAVFDCASIGTGLTRTFTFPNGNTILAGIGSTQTFTAVNTFSNATNTFGSATGTGTIGLASGAITTGLTKTVNIGTGGVSGSTTNIAIGSSVSGATSTTTMNGVVKRQVYTVATLPSASTSGSGATAFVSDALAPTFGATVVTGGAIPVPVYSDGTNWKVG